MTTKNSWGGITQKGKVISLVNMDKVKKLILQLAENDFEFGEERIKGAVKDYERLSHPYIQTLKKLILGPILNGGIEFGFRL